MTEDLRRPRRLPAKKAIVMTVSATAPMMRIALGAASSAVTSPSPKTWS